MICPCEARSVKEHTCREQTRGPDHMHIVYTPICKGSFPTRSPYVRRMGKNSQIHIMDGAWLAKALFDSNMHRGDGGPHCGMCMGTHGIDLSG